MGAVATNIRFPEHMLRELKVKAAKENKSLAELIREAVEETYHIKMARGQVTTRQLNEDSLLKLIGCCRSGTQDGSVRHDRDIYGLASE